MRLQAHTQSIFNPDTPIEHLKEITRKAGDAWISEHHPLLSKLTRPWAIIRWDSFLNHKRFPYFLELIKDEYQNNEALKDSFDQSIEVYLSRQLNVPIEVDEAKQKCLQYLLSECAVMALWAEYDDPDIQAFQFELYPRRRTPAMVKTYDEVIKPNHPQLLKPIELRFKRVQCEEYLAQGEIHEERHGIRTITR